MQRSDVRYVEAHGDYARLHTADGSHLVRVPLATLEEHWADAGFVRIHRSHLVALHHIDEMRIESGRCTVRARRRRAAGQPAAHPRAARHARPAGPAGARDRPTASEQPPRRVRIASPRTARVARAAAAPVAGRSTSRPTLGEVYMRSLLRTQLRLAARRLPVFAVLLGGLPLLFALAPRRREHLLGLPLPWLLLAGWSTRLSLAAWFYVRQAERNERDFTDVLERPDHERRPGRWSRWCW